MNHSRNQREDLMLFGKGASRCPNPYCEKEPVHVISPEERKDYECLRKIKSERTLYYLHCRKEHSGGCNLLWTISVRSGSVFDATIFDVIKSFELICIHDLTSGKCAPVGHEIELGIRKNLELEEAAERAKIRKRGLRSSGGSRRVSGRRGSAR
jgi:hypothetical protein